MSKNLVRLEEVNLSTGTAGDLAGETSSSPKQTRKAKKQRVSVLEDELSNLTSEDADEAAKRSTLENIFELAKMSSTADNSFFKDFYEINGIQQLLTFLKSGDDDTNNLKDPTCVSTVASLTYLCIMRGATAKQVADAFVENDGVQILLEANSIFVLNDNKEGNEGDSIEQQLQKEENRYKASSDIWHALGMIFCKAGKEMNNEQHISSIDSILSSMDKLGDITNTYNQKVKEEKEEEQNRKNSNISSVDNNDGRYSSHSGSNNSNDDNSSVMFYSSNPLRIAINTNATKALHNVYRALNYLTDHVKLTRTEIDEKQLFARCHAASRTKPRTVVTWETMTKSSTKIIPSSYRDDATIYLNTKTFFVTCFRNSLFETSKDYEEIIPLCVETIKRNSSDASSNSRAQDRRHDVFDLMMAACTTVLENDSDSTIIEKSGILSAIEMTLLADGTVQSSSKEKARELLKVIVSLM